MKKEDQTQSYDWESGKLIAQARHDPLTTKENATRELRELKKQEHEDKQSEIRKKTESKERSDSENREEYNRFKNWKEEQMKKEPEE